MRTVIGWVVVVVAVLAIGVLLASARGTAHPRGDEVGATASVGEASPCPRPTRSSSPSS